MKPTSYLINVRGKLVSLDTPKVMGILNLTPDSFYAESRAAASEALRKTEAMLKQGADFIDLGGYSTRPQNQEVAFDEEARRVVPVIESLSKAFPDAILSVDTFRSGIAALALDAGAHMVNDISGSVMDQNILKVAAERKAPYVMTHFRGTPGTMLLPENTAYDDLAQDVISFFSEKIGLAVGCGLSDIIIDPGFGFSKTIDQNYELLAKTPLLQIMLERPLLVGISRKSMIFKPLGINAAEALNGTTALHMALLERGANILRAHDVKEAAETIKLYLEIKAHLPYKV